MTPQRVILHCSATPDYDQNHWDFDKYGLLQIRRWHLARNWRDVGYHFIIRRSGVVEPGREMNVKGAHCKGENDDSIGVCFVGTREPTDFQFESMVTLYRLIKYWYGIGSDQWFGHNQFNAGKECPGVSIDQVRYVLEKSTHGVFDTAT